MKRLTLIRHGKSSWKDPDLDDIERPLNKRGKQDAPLMGERLARRGHLPDIILSSPAKRARKTAEAIAEKLGIPSSKQILERAIYAAEPSELLALVRRLEEDWQHVFLVGHNPGFTELGNLLADCGLDNLPTCGVLCLDFDVPTWKEVAPHGGTLVFLDYPKNPAADG
ncbi:phosphoglycerate mutase [Desulfuromonas versatilis]|uniref:Phosphoglycerate mutase n=1 Tax=Desulfuromonas versatilis TaxID=2802975 RepID=A0ABM8HXX2_9BACT|nr:histidine phosphatase family protein [Desulfuromonas versatilis]BCR06821.1 phosphoglycerate mutase [Desulfuromonas versatilis]